MKVAITIAAFFFIAAVYAQKKETFYDENKNLLLKGTPSYYSVVEFKDSLWYRSDYYLPERSIQFLGSYKDSLCKIDHGLFTTFYLNRKIQSQGFYKNGKKEGAWVSFHENGIIKDSTVYEKGMETGVQLTFHPNGYIADSATYNSNGSGVLVSWYDDGNPSNAGLFVAGRKRHGKWQYFYNNGKVKGIEIYDLGRLLSRQHFDSVGKEVLDLSLWEREASFKGGESAWREYLQNNLQAAVPVVNKAPKGSYTVIMQFVINSDGTISDLKPLTKKGYGMEEECMRILKKSPKWMPAILNGTPVKTTRKQPFTFVISEE